MLLASGSPRRIELLTEAGYDLRVMPADVDEEALEGESPTELVGRLAQLKAHARLADALPGEVVVGADTIVSYEGDLLGKPADDRDAARMLAELSGKTHQVSTGVCILVAADDTHDLREECFVDTTDVTFYDLTAKEIGLYVASGEPQDKAGAYGIQGTGRLLVRKIDGDFYNVVGLPVARVVRAINQLET